MEPDQTRSTTPHHTVGYGEEYLQFLSYSEDLCEYLLGQLRPGDRVIDIGCRPGFTSVGLAGVAPEKLRDLDVAASQVELARNPAGDPQSETAKWQVADAAALPFEDGFFDVAHCNDVLAYVPQTGAVLTEVMRVLKPGGILGCREIIVDSSFVHPELGPMKRGWEVFADLLEADDGHPQMGKDLKHHLLEAGFTDIRISASFENYSGPEQVDHFHRHLKRWFFSLDVTERAKMYGAATDTLFGVIEEAVDQWKDRPGAWAGIAFGEALAVRP